jgi:hypothetical protein
MIMDISASEILAIIYQTSRRRMPKDFVISMVTGVRAQNITPVTWI